MKTQAERQAETEHSVPVDERDREREAQSVYGTTDGEHPGVASMRAAGASSRSRDLA